MSKNVCTMVDPQDEAVQPGPIKYPAASRDHILEVADNDIIPFEVPEWRCTIYLRRLTAGESDRYNAENLTNDGKPDIKALTEARTRFCALSICDEEGARMFVSAKDIQGLGSKSARVLDRIYFAAQKHNDADVDELAGN